MKKRKKEVTRAGSPVLSFCIHSSIHSLIHSFHPLPTRKIRGRNSWELAFTSIPCFSMAEALPCSQARFQILWVPLAITSSIPEVQIKIYNDLQLWLFPSFEGSLNCPCYTFSQNWRYMAILWKEEGGKLLNRKGGREDPKQVQPN